MPDIILTTLNARYTHSAIGLRYIYANMAELQGRAAIREFVINDNVQDIAERLLAERPAIIGIGVYIWNALQCGELLATIKKVAPQTIVILGGPEVSYTPYRINFDAADYFIQGEGDVAFHDLCTTILAGNAPVERFIKAAPVNLDEIELPYRYYTDEDVANRYIYVEASRGCPFLCEFCLSSIDKKVRPILLDRLLEEFELLWSRGVRSFKFIDRTFNLNVATANRLLDFFLAKEPPYFVHFEVIPDHFPESVRERISRFPAASLQLEIGIQTLNPEVAKNIRRNLKVEKIEENIRFLETATSAHMHLDLIVGLPGESLQSFGHNLDRLCDMTSSEIQIGILKKLSGTTISRHDKSFGMVYSDKPPYDVLKNSLLSFEDIQRMKRFARFWDLYYNSGNFKQSLPLLWQDGSVFEAFYDFSLWIYGETDSTWKISLDRLAQLLFRYLIDTKAEHPERLAAMLIDDIMKIEGRNMPNFLKPYRHSAPKTKQLLSAHNKRQLRHI
ncbi:Radical SAM superfamily enzyme YgiQ, UPF0313 family [Mariprofundus ferrinatatus]|uniref:Radical SAM superfamily enzyme YgiQ, UPF0313 family n=1 Tax=Mariprofundus ferrinatatus TaxID=1921087 RepID=A0A2K8L761_9PROT|nr:B12-binding domain-containing radical SAM protein [Mariprofundus ferrinatatus]ATX81691.1 Radical SAM superfamily enzyme YgiQ, UPF0313 family [Mariprofundus ferrinatatus]